MPTPDPPAIISGTNPNALLRVGPRTWVDSSKEYAVAFLRVA